MTAADQTPATDSERVEQIRARVEVAGVGPWETYDANEGMDRAYAPMWCVANDAFHNPPADEDVEWVGIDVYVGDRDVADFIANARDDVPWLLDEVTRLTALLAEQAATIERLGQSLTDERDRVIQAIRDQGEWEPDQTDEYGRVELAGYVTIGARELSALGSQRTEGRG